MRHQRQPRVELVGVVAEPAHELEDLGHGQRVGEDLVRVRDLNDDAVGGFGSHAAFLFCSVFSHRFHGVARIFKTESVKICVIRGKEIAEIVAWVELCKKSNESRMFGGSRWKAP